MVEMFILTHLKKRVTGLLFNLTLTIFINLELLQRTKKHSRKASRVISLSVKMLLKGIEH